MQKKQCQEWDLNPRLHSETRTNGKVCYHLESGALDRSAILTSANVPLFTVS